MLEILEINRDDLKGYGVESISLFGSVARGEAGPRSDVDLLVDVDDEVTLFGLSRLKHHLEALLGMPVDLVTPDALRPQMRDSILAEAIRAGADLERFSLRSRVLRVSTAAAPSPCA